MRAPFETPIPGVPDARAWFPSLAAWLSTGPSAIDTALSYHPSLGPVSLDTETSGLGVYAFTTKCVTMAWDGPYGTESVLLDPRDPVQLSVVAKVTAEAPEILIHNAPFDVPPLVFHKMLRLEDVDKVTDTIVLARLAFPDNRRQPHNLVDLSVTLLGVPKPGGRLTTSFKCRGFTTEDAGWSQTDIDVPIYRYGAMADTVAGLRLVNPLRARAWAQQVEGHPFRDFGVDSAGAQWLIEREQIVNRIMLRRSAVGLAVDVDYLDRYAEQHAAQLAQAENVLEQLGLRPGQGIDVLEHLEQRGELPSGWPRTATGRLQADKKAMAALEDMDHPLALAHRTYSSLSKVQGYLSKVAAMVEVTGRVHGQVGVLGASATGRMAYSEPELQQFPADARPIITDDGQGLTSIDWSSIEPVVMANCAGDTAFLAPFESGADLYASIVQTANVERKAAKVVLLASMYGQGKDKLARSLQTTVDEAQAIKSRVMGAMPITAQYMDQVRGLGNQAGKAITISGRVLDIPRDFSGKFMGYKAVNYTCQGSAYDVLSETLVELKRQGLSDHVQLAMHDELVVDTPVAAEVRRVMETPPARLCWWADKRAPGKVPVLRTDMNDCGHHWQYV